jgi:hypothetical protein
MYSTRITFQESLSRLSWDKSEAMSGREAEYGKRFEIDERKSEKNL